MRIFVVAVTLVALAGCSEPSPAPRSAGPSPSVPAGDDGSRGHTRARPKPSRAERGDGGRRAGRAQVPGDHPPDDGATEGGADGGGGPVVSGGPRPYPAAGRYAFAQTGWEEFCQATCERRDLAPSQTVDVSLREATAERAIVVQEARQSDSRLTRTTLVFTRSAALITSVYARVTYSGFTIEERYDPDPPVSSLLFPLNEGKTWSGRWDASTSGDYSMEVRAHEEVHVGGRTVDAAIVRSLTHFRGEYEGSGDITVWIDPRTRSVVKSVGDLELESRFGRYATHFEIDLTTGPGYR